MWPCIYSLFAPFSWSGSSEVLCCGVQLLVLPSETEAGLCLQDVLMQCGLQGLILKSLY